jgi:wee1-like protein kinase
LYQMCTALHCMHSHNLVHLDVKNANIFIQSDGTYKLGDLGQTVLAEVEEPRTVEEGDGKYLCRTLLEEDSRFFIQADIFSLGASVYELARQCELQSGGQKWHDLRDGHLEPLPNYSDEFVSILGSMMHPDPLSRPSAGELLLHPYFQREDISHTQSLLDRIRILEGEVSRLKAVEACMKRSHGCGSGY